MRRIIGFYVATALLCGAGVLGVMSGAAAPTAECAAGGTCEEACAIQFNNCRRSGKKMDTCRQEFGSCQKKCASEKKAKP